MSEEHLIQRAQNGDRSALGEVLLQQYESLSRIMAPKIPETIRRTISVEDVLQATFAEAYRNIEKFEYRGPGSLTAWLLQIADFRLRDVIKSQLAQKRGGGRQQQEKAAHATDSVADLIELVTAGITSPSRAVSRQEAIAALNAAIRSLPQLHADVIRMRFLEGRSLEETAATLGRSTDAIRSLTFRAKQELRDALKM